MSLAVNTNQYARTFQDRSYKFAIKKRPTEPVVADDGLDTPYIPAIPEDTKIFNVNVRGKRGNIVQTYPAVEYDFVPNSLALDAGDMVHWQWTGSDYNPRRGCNDAEGGPPDPNDFVSSTNQNSRADRSNLVFLSSMAENAPMDYVSYDTYTDDDNVEDPLKNQYVAKVSNMKELLLNATPCPILEDECFEQVMRLSYLNQQSDSGALGLRRGRPCLTQQELDDIDNNQERENVSSIHRPSRLYSSTTNISFFLSFFLSLASAELRQDQRKTLPVLRCGSDEGVGGRQVRLHVLSK